MWLCVLYIDITIELRALGVPWTLHCWMHALAAAHELRLDTVIDQLLQDSILQVCPDDYSQQFVTECLPLLFSIFRYSKVCVSNNFSPPPTNLLTSLYFFMSERWENNKGHYTNVTVYVWECFLCVQTTRVLKNLSNTIFSHSLYIIKSPTEKKTWKKLSNF